MSIREAGASVVGGELTQFAEQISLPGWDAARGTRAKGPRGVPDWSGQNSTMK